MTQPPRLQPSQVPPESRDSPPPRRRRSWSRGRKRLAAGIAAFGLLLVIGAIVNATGNGKTAVKVADPATRSTTAAAKASTGATANASTGAAVKAGTGASAKAGTGASTGPNASTGAGVGTAPSAGGGTGGTPGASQDCLDQARAWLSGGSSQIAALEGAFGGLDAAAQALVSAAGHGAHRDIPAVEGAAGALRSAAGAVEANPGPSCVPGLRANLMAGAADYAAVAGDAESAAGALETGQVGAAQADVDAARPLAAEGTASIAAAEAAENFSG